jgi:hypothetical protein
MHIQRTRSFGNNTVFQLCHPLSWEVLALLVTFWLRHKYLRIQPSCPKLPDILSSAIKSQVFTHGSFFARQSNIFEDHPLDPSPDNEKFEHLGDTGYHKTLAFFPSLSVPSSSHFVCTSLFFFALFSVLSFEESDFFLLIYYEVCMYI